MKVDRHGDFDHASASEHAPPRNDGKGMGPIEDDAGGRAEDDARNHSLYRGLLADHGLTHAALNWGSAEGQMRRFEVLAEGGIADGDSVLDVGCGTGDLLAFLRGRGHVGVYRGIDITPEMVGACRTRFPDVRFDVANLMTDDLQGFRECDVVVASGLFYYRRHEPAAYMRQMVERLFSLATKLLVFNSLSAWADRPSEGVEFRADPIKTLNFCRGLSAKVALRHDYHPGDFTIYLRR